MVNKENQVPGIVEVNAADAQQVSGGSGAYLRGRVVASANVSLDGFVAGGSTQRAGTPGTTLCHLKTTETLFGCKPKFQAG